MKKYLMLFALMLCCLCAVACGDSFDGITIKFRVPSGTISNALQTIIPEFEAQHEGEIRVDLDLITGGYDGLLTQNVYDLNNGKAPTMTLGYPDHFALYLSGEGLVSLNQYIERDSYDLSDFIESYLPENKLSDNNDDYYGLPFNKSTEVMIYNKTVFDAMGYKVPETWDDVETLGLQIIADCKAGKLDNIAGVKYSETDKKPSEYLASNIFYPLSYDSTDNAFITICRQWDGDYTQRETMSKGYALFNNEEVIEGLSYFQTLAQRGLFSVAESFDESYASNAFKNLQCLITIGSSAGVGYNLPSGDKFEIGVAPIPYKDEDHKFVISQGTNICIMSQCTQEEQDAAWELIKFLLSTENTTKFATLTGGYLPVRYSAYETQEYKNHLDPELNLNYHYALSSQVGIEYRDNYRMFVDPAFVGSSTVRDAVGTAFSKIIVQNEDISKTLSETISTLGPKYQKKG